MVEIGTSTRSMPAPGAASSIRNSYSKRSPGSERSHGSTRAGNPRSPVWVSRTSRPVARRNIRRVNALPARLRSGTGPVKLRTPSTIAGAAGAGDAKETGDATAVPPPAREPDPATDPDPALAAPAATSAGAGRAASSASATRAMSAGVCCPSASAVTTSSPARSRSAMLKPVRRAAPLPRLCVWCTTRAPARAHSEKTAA